MTKLGATARKKGEEEEEKGKKRKRNGREPRRIEIFGRG